MRISTGPVVVGSRSSDPSRARRQLPRAAQTSRLNSHVPARMCQEKDACGSPAASKCSDQRGVLIDQCRITGFDGGSETPVQIGTI